MLEAALALAARGFHVFPLAPRDKHPLISAKHGGRGHLDATTDAAQLRAWWRACPEANIGLRPDGLIVVDIDTNKGGDATMRALVNVHGRLPSTLCSRTGSGGWHFLFKLPTTPLRQGSNVLGRGVDTRVDALGYIAAPPSIHPCGGTYQWVKNLDPAPCPPWLALLAAPLPVAAPPPARVVDVDVMQRALAFIRHQAEHRPSIQGQNGSGALFAAAVALVRGFLLSEGAALSVLLSTFNPSCVPPWPERDVKRAVARATRSNRPAGYLVNAPRRVA